MAVNNESLVSIGTTEKEKLVLPIKKTDVKRKVASLTLLLAMLLNMTGCSNSGDNREKYDEFDSCYNTVYFDDEYYAATGVLVDFEDANIVSELLKKLKNKSTFNEFEKKEIIETGFVICKNQVSELYNCPIENIEVWYDIIAFDDDFTYAKIFDGPNDDYSRSVIKKVAFKQGTSISHLIALLAKYNKKESEFSNKQANQMLGYIHDIISSNYSLVLDSGFINTINNDKFETCVIDEIPRDSITDKEKLERVKKIEEYLDINIDNSDEYYAERYDFIQTHLNDYIPWNCNEKEQLLEMALKVAKNQVSQIYDLSIDKIKVYYNSGENYTFVVLSNNGEEKILPFERGSNISRLIAILGTCNSAVDLSDSDADTMLKYVLNIFCSEYEVSFDDSSNPYIDEVNPSSNVKTMN